MKTCLIILKNNLNLVNLVKFKLFSNSNQNIQFLLVFFLRIGGLLIKTIRIISFSFGFFVFFLQTILFACLKNIILRSTLTLFITIIHEIVISCYSFEIIEESDISMCYISLACGKKQAKLPQSQNVQDKLGKVYHLLPCLATKFDYIEQTCRHFMNELRISINNLYQYNQ